MKAQAQKHMPRPAHISDANDPFGEHPDYCRFEFQDELLNTAPEDIEGGDFLEYWMGTYAMGLMQDRMDPLEAADEAVQTALRVLAFAGVKVTPDHPAFRQFDTAPLPLIKGSFVLH